MTVNQLSQLCYMKTRCQKLHARLGDLRLSASTVGSPQFSMPRSTPHRESRVEKYALQIADVETELDALELQMAREEIRLQRYISTVPDSRLRLILTYRFVDCDPTWYEVARRLGGDNDAESVKKLCYRFLRSTEQPAQTRESV